MNQFYTLEEAKALSGDQLIAHTGTEVEPISDRVVNFLTLHVEDTKGKQHEIRVTAHPEGVRDVDSPEHQTAWDRHLPIMIAELKEELDKLD